MGIKKRYARYDDGALVEDRDPWLNAVTSANWTCVGICAHESALKGGEIVRLPEFTLQTNTNVPEVAQ